MADLHQPSLNITRTVSVATDASAQQQQQQPQTPPSPPDQNELTQLSMMIKTWRDIQKETEELTTQVKERKKRCKVMEEVILRIMKKNNIGALDLQSSGGRLLYRRQTTKAGLGQKDMARLLADHLKSEQAASTALQYIAEHRGTKVKESLLYEKD